LFGNRDFYTYPTRYFNRGLYVDWKMFDNRKWHFLLNCDVKRTGNGNRKWFVYNNVYWDLYRVRHMLEVFHRIRVGHWHMHIHNLLSHDRIVVGDFGHKICLTHSSSTILLEWSQIFILSMCSAFPRLQLGCLLRV